MDRVGLDRVGRARQEWKGWTGVGSMDRVGLDRVGWTGQGGQG